MFFYIVDRILRFLRRPRPSNRRFHNIWRGGLQIACIRRSTIKMWDLVSARSSQAQLLAAGYQI
jgi:hypothetical protein